MKLRVDRYSDTDRSHVCTDLDTGNTHKVDLYVDGNLDGYADNPKSLVGKVVQLDRLVAYLELACGVSGLSDPADEQEANAAAAE